MTSSTDLIRRTLKQAEAKLFEKRLERIAPTLSFDPRNAIIISANPRGGSTWLFEMLKQIPGTASLLEPLHKSWIDEVNELNFDWHQRIPEEADWPEARALFERILSGHLVHPKTCQHSPISHYKSADRLVLKFVRANGLLPWLLRQFDFRLKPVVLTRHPFAMAASMVRHPGWSDMPSHYVFPQSPFMEYSQDERSFLESLTTPEEVMVAKWCTRNRGLLRHPRHNQDWITLHYEILLLRPEDTIRYLFAEWNMPVPPAVLQNINKASREALETDFLRDKTYQLNKWHTRFTPQQIARLQRIMDFFEIDLYSKDPMPNLQSNLAGRQPL